ncbi:uncharacterized protein LOC141880222 isoform X1 [Acropora palmata]|uniref:uncharacterized protein LOC141880222 isoform X1 n=2 Tax=Acropora palmata TaxID=6131 RepID=UPI003DA0FFE5
MAQANYAESHSEEITPSSRDWLFHTNHSLSRLKEVKKTSYRLGGGPKEREVNCQCNNRSKSKGSFSELNSESPMLAMDSQGAASMLDMSVPELMRQFNERKQERNTSKRRPRSSLIYTSKSFSRKCDKSDEKPSTKNYNAFIAVKGRTPQLHPPPGSQKVFDSKEDNNAFKELYHLDEQVQRRSPSFGRLRKYLPAFDDNEDDPSEIPPPPCTSPERDTPRISSPECKECEEHSLSEEDVDEMSNKSSEAASFSAGSRSLVFAIPIGNDEDASDDETDISEFKPGRVSADYVRRSEGVLNEVDEKNISEAAEISDMMLDMENARQKIGKLRISPRDLDLDLETSANQSALEEATPLEDVVDVPVSSVRITHKPNSRPSVEKVTSLGDESYEAFWVEEPVGRVSSNAPSWKNNRACPARYMSKPEKHSARVRKHESEGLLALKGRTVEFFNSEDLSAGNRLRDLRRTSEPKRSLDQLGSTDENRNAMEANVNSKRKVETKPPLPHRSSSVKTNKNQGTKEKDPLMGKNSGTDVTVRKSSLRKASSDGNIPLSVTAESNTIKKSVTFSQEVLKEDNGGEFECSKTKNSLDTSKQTTDTSMTQEGLEKPTPKSCLWLDPGIVIQNGLEMEAKGLQLRKSLETSSATNNHHKKSPQNTRAKILARMKETSGEREPCACREITRPTAAVLAEAKRGDLEARETSSRSEKLLKNRSSRPSSAPMKRSSISNENEIQRPKSPRRKPRVMSARVQRKKSGTDGTQIRPRPSSAHVGSSSSKDARRNRAAVKVLKEGYLFKERPPPPLPPEPRERQQNKQKGNEDEDDKKAASFTMDEGCVVASEECEQVYARLQEKGIGVSMETIKRGLMPPARKASDLNLAFMGTSSGLLSKPETWLPEEYARVQIWNNVLKSSK